MAILELRVEGIPRSMARVRAMTRRLRDLRPLWEFAHRAFRLEMEEQFATQGAHLTGEQWAPLSPDYARDKPRWLRRHGYPPVPPPYGILYRTGRLHESFVDPGHEDHVARMTPSKAVFGSKVEYGKYHQAGGGSLPQRKIVLVRPLFRLLIHRAMTLYLLTGRLPAFTGAAARGVA